MTDYSKVFPTNKIKSQIRSSEANIGKLYSTAVDLVAASSAIFLEDLVRQCVSSSSSSSSLSSSGCGGDGNNFVLTQECIMEMLEKEDNQSSFFGLKELIVQSYSLHDPKILSKYGRKKRNRSNIQRNPNGPPPPTITATRSGNKNKKQKIGNSSSLLGTITAINEGMEQQNDAPLYGMDLLEFGNSKNDTIIQDEEDYDS